MAYTYTLYRTLYGMFSWTSLLWRTLYASSVQYTPKAYNLWVYIRYIVQYTSPAYNLYIIWYIWRILYVMRRSTTHIGVQYTPSAFNLYIIWYIWRILYAMRRSTTHIGVHYTVYPIHLSDLAYNIRQCRNTIRWFSFICDKFARVIRMKAYKILRGRTIYVYLDVWQTIHDNRGAMQSIRQFCTLTLSYVYTCTHAHVARRIPHTLHCVLQLSTIHLVW